jgi:hypothetical protein
MSGNRCRVLGLVLVLSLVVLALAPLPANAFVCHRQNLDDLFTYFSDATMTHAVGTCENDCGQCWCSGRQTPYYQVITSRIC